MIPAGRIQDKISPKITALISGLLVGLGLIISAITCSITGFTIGFGLITGAGIGFGYAAATPPAIKWFPANKTGIIVGLVVSGFGLASIYIAPLSNYLINHFGIKNTLLFFGIGFSIIIVSLSQLLITPKKTRYLEKQKIQTKNIKPFDMLKQTQFYILWIIYACGAGAGLMVISIIKKITPNLKVGTIAIMILALGNGIGRILAGLLSDKISRKTTLIFFLLLQGITVLFLSIITNKENYLSANYIIIGLSFLTGMNYGSNLSLFPAITKDYFGLENFGVNYGILFTAWGVGGFTFALFAGKVYDLTHSFSFAFKSTTIALIAASILTPFLRNPLISKNALTDKQNIQ